MHDKLVKRLRNAAQLADKGLVILPSVCLEAADAIENTSKAYQMMAEAYEAEVTKHLWISVTERLPEKGYYVLAYEDGDIMMASYNDGNWVLRDLYEIIDDLKPTHWMPLPEPPKEK
jgi:hypothetical protein